MTRMNVSVRVLDHGGLVLYLTFIIHMRGPVSLVIVIQASSHFRALQRKCYGRQMEQGASSSFRGSGECMCAN